jgi:hypothetical protein
MKLVGLVGYGCAPAIHIPSDEFKARAELFLRQTAEVVSRLSLAQKVCIQELNAVIVIEIAPLSRPAPLPLMLIAGGAMRRNVFANNDFSLPKVYRVWLM